jgi:sugar lactone lactonase YvrE
MQANRAWAGFVLVLLTASALPMLVGCGSGSGSSATGPQATTHYLLAADGGNNRVLLFDAPFSTGQSASVVLGQIDFTTSVQTTTATGLKVPVKAIADSDGNIWVSDQFNNRVLQYQKPITNGMAATVVLGQSGFTTSVLFGANPTGFAPNGIAFDKNGDLWVADEFNRVLEFTPPFSNDMAASLVLGQPNFTTNVKGTTASGLFYPTELAFDASGDLWVVDNGNNRVLEYKPPFTSGQSASVVMGQPDFTSSAIATTAAGMSAPYGVAFDPAGNIWVSDYHNSRILMFAPPFSDGQEARLVLGQPDFTSSGGTGDSQVDVVYPQGLAFDSDGNLYVADTAWSRVIVFEPPFSTQMKASTVIGQPNFSTHGTGTTPSGLFGVYSVSTF